MQLETPICRPKYIISSWKKSGASQEYQEIPGLTDWGNLEQSHFSPRTRNSIFWRGTSIFVLHLGFLGGLGLHHWVPLNYVSNNVDDKLGPLMMWTETSMFHLWTEIPLLKSALPNLRRGYKRYWVRDFPFDRHVISLCLGQHFEICWLIVI